MCVVNVCAQTDRQTEPHYSGRICAAPVEIFITSSTIEEKKKGRRTDFRVINISGRKESRKRKTIKLF